MKLKNFSILQLILLFAIIVMAIIFIERLLPVFISISENIKLKKFESNNFQSFFFLIVLFFSLVSTGLYLLINIILGLRIIVQTADKCFVAGFFIAAIFSVFSQSLIVLLLIFAIVFGSYIGAFIFKNIMRLSTSLKRSRILKTPFV